MASDKVGDECSLHQAGKALQSWWKNIMIFDIGSEKVKYKCKSAHRGNLTLPTLAGELGEMKEGDGMIPPTPPGDGAWPNEGEGT